MRWIGKGRFMLPARALGACERLVEMGMDYARTRETFGEPIANRQAIQWMIADSAVEIEALRWLVLTAAWLVLAPVVSQVARQHLPGPRGASPTFAQLSDPGPLLSELLEVGAAGELRHDRGRLRLSGDEDVRDETTRRAALRE